jgi:hypothetical protein
MANYCRAVTKSPRGTPYWHKIFGKFLIQYQEKFFWNQVQNIYEIKCTLIYHEICESLVITRKTVFPLNVPHFLQFYALICFPVKENNYFYVAIITIRDFRENASIKLIIFNIPFRFVTFPNCAININIIYILCIYVYWCDVKWRFRHTQHRSVAASLFII